MGDCAGHVWQLTEVRLGAGVHSDYACLRCGELLTVGPGGVHPETA